MHVVVDDKPHAFGWTRARLPMQRRIAAALPAVIWCLTLAAAGSYLVMYGVLVLRRLPYPFELEWMEGGSLQQLQRIVDGLPLYAEPQLNYVPFLYPPLYFYAAAAVAQVTGVGFLPLRLVSIAASVVCFWLIYLITRRETGRAAIGLISAGLFAATYNVSGAWLDIARVDSLHLALMLAAIYVAQHQASRWTIVGAGAVMGLAFLTKQTAGLVMAFLALYWALTDRRALVIFVAAFAVVGGGGIALIDALWDGWPSYYLFTLPGQDRIVRSVLLTFWQSDVMAPLGVACVVAIFGLGALAAQGNGLRARFWLLVLAGMVAAGLAGRLTYGGVNNALMPTYAAIAIVFGLGMDRAMQITSSRAGAFLQGSAWKTYVLGLALAQFCLLGYDPRQDIPTTQDLQAGQALVERLRAVHGDVYMPDSGYLPVMAGKPWYAHSMGLDELTGGFGGSVSPAGYRLMAELQDDVLQRRFGAVVLSGFDARIANALERVYHLDTRSAIEDPAVFWPVSGGKYRPRFWLDPLPE